ncbi:ANTAR domain-containing protein [Jatrophihabitans sp.]|uniref:ANTAR domain-containing protein n=1 Tax=Jatrophihabitans sp. TaxID=1932789 RepID=UPI002EE8AE03
MDTNEMLELSQEFALLAAELHGDGDNQAALRRLVELAVKHVEGCGWASITAVRGGQGHSVAISDEVAQQVDDLQYKFGEGPCMAAAENASDYLLFDITDEPRWPRFTEAAAEQTPVRSVLAFQLAAGRAVALNLYADQRGAFSSDAIDTATIFAAQASCLIALNEAEDQATNLEAALESSRAIGVALGVLMSARKVTQEQAFALLRVASQNLHRKLRTVAAEVVETGTLPDLPEPKPAKTAEGSGSTRSTRSTAGAVSLDVSTR